MAAVVHRHHPRLLGLRWYRPGLPTAAELQLPERHRRRLGTHGLPADGHGCKSQPTPQSVRRLPGALRATTNHRLYLPISSRENLLMTSKLTHPLFLGALFALATVAGAQVKTSAPESGQAQNAQASPQPDKTIDCGTDSAVDYGVATSSRDTAISGSCQTTVSQTPVACPSATVNWGPGNNCSASISNTSHGSTRTPSSTAPQYAGTATFQCVNGIYYLSGTSTCTYVPADCPSQSVTWTETGFTCSGNAFTTAHGATRTVNNTAASRTGSAEYQCDDGSLNYLSGTCDQSDRPCPAQSFQWTVNGFNCSGSMSNDVTHLTTVTTSVPAGQPTTGSITHRCNNGTFQQTSPAPTCQASNAAAVCKSYPSSAGYSSQPATDLSTGCDVGGSYTDLTNTNDEWRWRCNGVGSGSSANCSAFKVSEPGQCASFPGSYNTQPADASNGCIVGAFSDATNTTTRFRWNCIGPRSGGTTACEAVVATITPACLTYSGTHSSQPATNTATGCTAGFYLDTADSSSHWNWQCTGQGGPSPVNCSALKPAVNGQCGSAAKNYLHTDTAYTGEFCSAGSPISTTSTNAYNPPFPEQGSSTSWRCSGVNGGNPSATCTATREAPPEATGHACSAPGACTWQCVSDGEVGNSCRFTANYPGSGESNWSFIGCTDAPNTLHTDRNYAGLNRRSGVLQPAGPGALAQRNQGSGTVDPIPASCQPRSTCTFEHPASWSAGGLQCIENVPSSVETLYSGQRTFYTGSTTVFGCGSGSNSIQGSGAYSYECRASGQLATINESCQCIAAD